MAEHRVTQLGFSGPILGWALAENKDGIKVWEFLPNGEAADHFYKFT